MYVFIDDTVKKSVLLVQLLHIGAKKMKVVCSTFLYLLNIKNEEYKKTES
ncbi:hypothetical protein FEM49_03346 (plasmid) [Lactiplantibacillus plantarum]|nr:hypothetical protein FEM49_03346 [Lactiplantibacillus plantarum]